MMYLYNWVNYFIIHLLIPWFLPVSAISEEFVGRGQIMFYASKNSLFDQGCMWSDALTSLTLNLQGLTVQNSSPCRVSLLHPALQHTAIPKLPEGYLLASLSRLHLQPPSVRRMKPMSPDPISILLLQTRDRGLYPPRYASYFGKPLALYTSYCHFVHPWNLPDPLKPHCIRQPFFLHLVFQDHPRFKAGIWRFYSHSSNSFSVISKRRMKKKHFFYYFKKLHLKKVKKLNKHTEARRSRELVPLCKIHSVVVLDSFSHSTSP